MRTSHKILLFTCLFFGFFSIAQDLDQKNWADSVYQFIDQNGVQNNITSEDFDQLRGIYLDKDYCKYLKAYLLESDALLTHGESEKALEKCMAFFESFDTQCDSNIYIVALITEGEIYYQNKQYQKAIDIAIQAENVYTSTWGNPHKLASIYVFRGNVALTQENYEEAIQWYEKGLSMLPKQDYESTVFKYYFNLAMAYYLIEDEDRSNDYLALARKNAGDSKNDILKCRVYNFMAAKAPTPDLQIKYIDSAIAIVIENRVLTDIVDFYENKSIALEMEKRYQEAYNIMWDASFYRDSLYQEQTAKAVAQLKAKYHMAQKDIEIKALQIDQQANEIEKATYESNQTKLIFGSIILACGIIILSIRYFEIKKTKDLLRLKNETITLEKNRSDELLLNILPSEVAEELKSNGTSEARDFDKVTVLFSDFEEFTRTATHLTAKELVEEINECFKAFDDIMQKHKIEKIKTIGDAYMAAAGLHTPKTCDPKGVVQAGIEMQAFMMKRNERRKAYGLPYFDMRVGIHTGPVVAGIVGVKKFQYDIWGDTVNTASRMESNGEVSKVNISQTTYSYIKDLDQFAFESRGKVDVKGKGEMDMWFVENKADLES